MAPKASTWRTLWTRAAEGAYNMALDEAIFQEVQNGNSPPTIRVYTWSAPCISLGHSQNIAAPPSGGYSVVRRPTGGLAVWHGSDIAYSITARGDALSWCGTRRDSMARISAAWIAVFADYGVGSHVSAGGYPRNGGACFSRPSVGEITWKRRKLIGSAQRRTRAGFLQQGSILVDDHQHRLGEVWEPDDTLKQGPPSVSLSEITGGPVPAVSLAAYLPGRLAGALGVRWIPGKPSPVELARASACRGHFALSRRRG